MNYHSKATTPEEFRQELLNYLSREATRLFSEKRRLERFINRKRDIHDLTTSFHKTCEIRDFITAIQFPEAQPTNPEGA